MCLRDFESRYPFLPESHDYMDTSRESPFRQLYVVWTFLRNSLQQLTATKAECFIDVNFKLIFDELPIMLCN